MRAKRLSRKELNQLAWRVASGEVVLMPIGAPGWEYSFGWLFSMLDEPLTESQMATIGACYEEYAKALPRGINGYPMFASMRLLHVQDLMPLHKRIVRRQRQLDGVPVLRRLMLRAMGT